MPKILLKFYTLFRTAAGTGELTLDLPPGSRIRDALESACRRLGEDFRALVWDKNSGQVLPFLVTFRGKVVPSTANVLDKTVDEGDVVILMDPVGGGFLSEGETPGSLSVHTSDSFFNLTIGR